MTKIIKEIDDDKREEIAFNRCVGVMTDLIKKYGPRVLRQQEIREFCSKYVYYIFRVDLTANRFIEYCKKKFK